MAKISCRSSDRKNRKSTTKNRKNRKIQKTEKKPEKYRKKKKPNTTFVSRYDLWQNAERAALRAAGQATSGNTTSNFKFGTGFFRFFLGCKPPPPHSKCSLSPIQRQLQKMSRCKRSEPPVGSGGGSRM